MIEKKEGSRQNLIKLNIDEIIKPDGPERLTPTENSNDIKDKSEFSQKEFSSLNNPELKLDEEENNNNDSHSNTNFMNMTISQTKKNHKISQKKTKIRRSRLTIDPNEDFCVQHSRKIYTEEEKIKKAIDNSLYFNSNVINHRNDLNIHFLKRKIEQNFEREDKLQIFFNVPFFPKEDMFNGRQLALNNAYLYNMNRNNQYNMQNNKMIPNRNPNYQNNRYINNNLNHNNNVNNHNNLKPNSGINLGKPNNTGNNITNNKNANNANNNKINSNINLGNNLNKPTTNNNAINNKNTVPNNNAADDNTDKSNKTVNNKNQSAKDSNNQINNNSNTKNNSDNQKVSISILDSSLIKEGNNNNLTNGVNKVEGNNAVKKNGLLFALKTNNPQNINLRNNINNEKELTNDNKNIFKQVNNDNKEMKNTENINNSQNSNRFIDLGAKKLQKEKSDKKENKNENSNKKLYNVIKE